MRGPLRGDCGRRVLPAFWLALVLAVLCAHPACPGRAGDPAAAGVETLLCFGDSITQGYPYIPSPPNGTRVGGYEPALEILMGTLSRSVVALNYGWGGENTDEGLARLFGILQAVPCDRVLILEGTNDFWDNISSGTTVANLSLMVDACRFFGVEPILATLTPSSRHSPGNIEYNLNPAIVAMAQQKQVRVCDQYALMSLNWGAWADDGLHPNWIGYVVMALAWLDPLMQPSAGAWLLRDIDGDLVLAQQDEDGAVEVWQLGPGGAVTGRTPLAVSMSGWQARSLDGNRVLFQQGTGGQSGIWEFGPAWQPVAWRPVYGRMDGWILRSLDGDRILAQDEAGGAVTLWVLGADSALMDTLIVASALPGWTARSLDSDRLLLQRGTWGMTLGVKIDPGGTPVGVWVVNGSFPGWVSKARDGQQVLLQRADGAGAGIWQLGPDGTPESFTPIL